MHLALFTLALQLRAVALGAPPPLRPSADLAADSVRTVRRARSDQAAFERVRRASLPWEGSSGGRCEVRIRRFCWWYDEESPSLPDEDESLTRRRSELIRSFDEMSRQIPGDDWLAGMTVHYRVDARQWSSADSAAVACHATTWWCHALLGYAAQMGGRTARADSAFEQAFREMPDDLRCGWTDIRTLLPGDARGHYESLPCTDRAPMEHRYWLLSRPRLASPANDWRTEFSARRVQAWLAQRSITPQTVTWGDDAEELLLRYGWPVKWGRVQQSTAALAPDVGIIGHDPSPSFAFGPREALLDSAAASGDDGWDLRSHDAVSRYAPRGIRRVAGVAVQLARFRRGDSTLVTAAFAAQDDSLNITQASLGVALDDGTTVASPSDSVRRGVARVQVGGAPRIAGVEVVDTTSGTFARSRTLFAPTTAANGVALSDLLLYRPGEVPASSLDSALITAIPGDTVGRAQPVGVFWETYGLAEGGESVDVAVTVERIDHGFLRSARQRLGLADPDSPLRVRWTDARPVAGAAPHAVSLDVGKLPAGRYRLTLSVIAGGEPVSSSREIELLER